MMKYPIAEIFESIQGEGIDTGMHVAFVRLAGCNMSCEFCDTDHSMTQERDEEELESMLRYAEHVVFTGGEPLLFNLQPIIYRLGRRVITVETNGSIEVPDYFRFRDIRISLSPKVLRGECQLRSCTSLKIIYPYLKDNVADMWQSFPADYRSLQVISPEKNPGYISFAMVEVRRLGYPWRVGIQLHKMIGVK